jgi:hypothetical protein
MKSGGINSRKTLVARVMGGARGDGARSLSATVKTGRRRSQMYLLPSVVGGAVAGAGCRGGVDVGDAGFLLVDGHHDIFLYDFPVGLAGQGIERNLPEISGGDQVIERLGRFLLIERVLRDDGAESRQIGAQNGLARLDYRLVIDRHGNGGQDHDDENDHHEFEQGEAAGVPGA